MVAPSQARCSENRILSLRASSFSSLPLRCSSGAGRRSSPGETALAEANTRATLAEARLSDFKSMLDDIREQRDRWQQQAERLAALAITDQRKERSPAQPQSWRQMLRAPTGQLLFLWV